MNIYESLENAEMYTDPFRHHEISNMLTQEEARLIDEYNFGITPNPGNKNGTRSRIAPIRKFLDDPLCESLPLFGELRETLLSRKAVLTLEELTSKNLRNSFLRIEIAFDDSGFWLTPHIDLPEKLLTVIVCIRPGTHDSSDGTDLYNRSREHIKTSKFLPGSALLITNGSECLHGVSKKTYQYTRKTLQISYVSQNWRDKQQLCGKIFT